MSEPLSAFDEMLRRVYCPPPDEVAKAKADPRIRRFLALGGTRALDGVKIMRSCRGKAHARYECPCPEHEDRWHLKDPTANCRLCGHSGEVWTGKWKVRPMKRGKVRSEMLRIRKEVGWIAISQVESPGIEAMLNASVPLYTRLKEV